MRGEGANTGGEDLGVERMEGRYQSRAVTVAHCEANDSFLFGEQPQKVPEILKKGR